MKSLKSELDVVGFAEEDMWKFRRYIAEPLWHGLVTPDGL